MWNRLVGRFFVENGDSKWIEDGLGSAEKRLQLIAELSQTLAYCPEILVMDDYFFDRFSSLSKQYILEAAHLVCYFQSLACYAQAVGLVAEEPVD